MIPDFLKKIGINSVGDNLKDDQIVSPTASLLAHLFTDEFFKKVDHGVNEHDFKEN